MRTSVVAIEKLAFGGAGFGHCDGKACFVPFAAPGDVVCIDVVAEKKSYINGRIRELIEPSRLRAIPPCPIFGACGGCDWQHLPYDVQLLQKQEIFVDLMARIARVGVEAIEPVLEASEPGGYRARVQLKLRFVAGKMHIGFYRAGSHFVVGIPRHCFIADPRVNALIDELNLLMPQFPEPDKIPQIDIAVGDDGRSLVIFHYIGSQQKQVAGFIKGNRNRLSSASGLWLQVGRKSNMILIDGIDALSYTVPEDAASGSPAVHLKFSRGGFSQVNYRQNLALIDLVRRWAGLTGRERILDIYCGNGNFSLPLAHNAANVMGMEEYEPSINDAIENCRSNGIRNAEYICIDAVSGVKMLAERGERFDLVVLDPPRTGAKEVVSSIGALGPRTVIYVSCDPATLARDIAIMRNSGFDVVKSRPVDMFPQTYHLESVTLLQSKIQTA